MCMGRCMCICIRICVCMCMCTCTCMRVCMLMWVWTWMNLWMGACACACVLSPAPSHCSRGCRCRATSGGAWCQKSILFGGSGWAGDWSPTRRGWFWASASCAFRGVQGIHPPLPVIPGADVCARVLSSLVFGCPAGQPTTLGRASCPPLLSCVACSPSLVPSLLPPPLRLGPPFARGVGLARCPSSARAGREPATSATAAVGE